MRQCASATTEAAAEQARLHNGGNEVSPTVLVSGQYLTNPTMRQVRRAVARP